MFRILRLAPLLACAAAAELHWVGRGRGAWNDTRSWSPARLPRANDTVVIGTARNASAGGALDCAAVANASGAARGADAGA